MWPKPCEKFFTFDLTSSRQCSRRQATINFTEATSVYKLYMERLQRQQEYKPRPSFLTELSHNLTGDESWMFEYDPESKRQSCAWHTKSSPRPKKARISKSRIKTMIIVFFDIRGIVHCYDVKENYTRAKGLYIGQLEPDSTIKIKDGNGVPQTCRALIDSGSQANFISGQCRKRLGLQYVTVHSQISGISGHFASHSYGLVEFEFTPHFKSDELFKVNALVLDKLTNNLPTLTCPKSNLAHLKTMPLADPDYNISAPIDILIGAELAMTLFTGESVIGDEEQLTATSSKLGWLLSGRVSSKGSRRSVRNIIRSHHACLETQDIVEKFGNWSPFLM
ncbi:hypothetical protein LAZ67_1006433 [Cordylochernes scorpioides]|uniref:Peptidase aspartic putative domain-containing protein n=1 Tax=Cordylochernes scorpioides TaxID=51811 RepID=A0ABY6JYK7_9ARAC|nr:hypothetical protein LAZ67_1006433 [Cordylochernes scorpioides]